MRKPLLAILISLLAIIPRISVRGVDFSNSWLRYPRSQERLSLISGQSFIIRVIENERYKLTAICSFRYTAGIDPVVLHGHRAEDAFWPRVNYEVATKGKTEWQRIASNDPNATPDTVTVGPQNPVLTIAVDLEPFRESIGVYRYGRLVLENGTSTILAIEDLLPTRAAHGTDNDFTDDIIQTDEEKAQMGFERTWIANKSVLFNSITRLGDRVVGEFSIMSDKRDVHLPGKRTLDCDFWAKARFEAAKDDHKWITIGEPELNGRNDTLVVQSGRSKNVRIVLSAFLPRLHQYQYCKITFPNGYWIVFPSGVLQP